MAIQSNVCVCETCAGTQCNCECQHPAPMPAASCRCGEVCHCGDACNCTSCQHANARILVAR